MEASEAAAEVWPPDPPCVKGACAGCGLSPCCPATAWRTEPSWTTAHQPREQRAWGLLLLGRWPAARLRWEWRAARGAHAQTSTQGPWARLRPHGAMALSPDPRGSGQGDGLGLGIFLADEDPVRSPWGRDDVGTGEQRPGVGLGPARSAPSAARVSWTLSQPPALASGALGASARAGGL